MATIVDCPTCTRKLSVPEEMLGCPVRCPDCGGTFAAGPGGILPPSADEPEEFRDEPAASPLPAPALAGAVTAAVPPPAASSSDPLQRPCRYCGEPVETAAVHCRFCGEDLAEEVDRPWERPHRPLVRRDCEPHRVSPSWAGGTGPRSPWPTRALARASCPGRRMDRLPLLLSPVPRREWGSGGPLPPMPVPAGRLAGRRQGRARTRASDSAGPHDQYGQ
jgi:hypothetical protein